MNILILCKLGLVRFHFIERMIIICLPLFVLALPDDKISKPFIQWISNVPTNNSVKWTVWDNTTSCLLLFQENYTSAAFCKRNFTLWHYIPVHFWCHRLKIPFFPFQFFIHNNNNNNMNNNNNSASRVNTELSKATPPDPKQCPSTSQINPAETTSKKGGSSSSRKSSLDLYEEAATILGLTCSQTDSCKCIECQVGCTSRNLRNFGEKGFQFITATLTR